MSILNSLIEAGVAPHLPASGEMAMASYPARPRQVAPLHPGAVAADILEERDISMRAAAHAIDLSPTGLAKVLNGDSPVTPNIAVRFAAYFGSIPEMWLDMQRDFDLWQVRRELAPVLKKIVSIAPKKDERSRR